MSDSTEIDAALAQRLEGDPVLQALVPDGVWFDAAPQGSTRFIQVTLMDAQDKPVLGQPGQRRGFEECVYLVTATLQSQTGTDADAASARIDTLLEDQPLTIVGYTCEAIYRITRHRHTTVDSTDQAMRWQHRGGRYRIVAVPQQPSKRRQP